MRVHGIRVEESPVAGRARLIAEVEHARGEPSAETYWIDVPADAAASLSTTGTPWAALLVPLALRGDGVLRVDAPVDRHFALGLQEWADVWRTWDPAVAPLRFEADVEEPDAPAGDATAAFFSGGVDSWYTLLEARRRDADGTAERPPLRDLLCVWGFDIFLDNAPAFARLRERYAPVMASLGLRLLDVATNVRDTRWGKLQWEQQAHGCALAAVALALEPRFHTVLVAAGSGTRDLRPRGSHPLTDPLLSTARMRLVHDGATRLRVEKLVAIADEPAAQRTLHVCWQGFDDRNCGRCNKCLRTMATLEVLGRLSSFATFPAGAFDPRRLERLFTRTTYERADLLDIVALAREHGREEVAAAIEASLRRSDRLLQAMRLVQRARNTRFVWRWADAVERRLLGGTVH